MRRYTYAALKAAFLVLAAYSIGYTSVSTYKAFTHHPTEADIVAEILKDHKFYQSSGGVGIMALTDEEAKDCLDNGGCVIYKVDEVEDNLDKAYQDGKKIPL